MEKIDPITDSEIVEEIKGHIIPQYFNNANNQTMPVEKRVDNWFGKHDADMYKFVNFRDDPLNWVNSKLKLKNGMEVRCEVNMNPTGTIEDPNCIKLHPSGDSDSKKHVLDKLLDQIKDPPSEFTFTTQLYRNKSVINSIVHSAVLASSRKHGKCLHKLTGSILHQIYEGVEFNNPGAGQQGTISNVTLQINSVSQPLVVFDIKDNEGKLKDITVESVGENEVVTLPYSEKTVVVVKLLRDEAIQITESPT